LDILFPGSESRLPPVVAPIQTAIGIDFPLSQLKPQNFERKVNEEIRNIRKKRKY